ncbi:hypothetical protein BS78_05G096400 [Paspalum vaginatum]|nr:hypothetical protein BS78_05G096400 [Paspalum vaginatum]
MSGRWSSQTICRLGASSTSTTSSSRTCVGTSPATIVLGAHRASHRSLSSSFSSRLDLELLGSFLLSDVLLVLLVHGWTIFEILCYMANHNWRLHNIHWFSSTFTLVGCFSANFLHFLGRKKMEIRCAFVDLFYQHQSVFFLVNSALRPSFEEDKSIMPAVPSR